jgi:hypothetical protein
MAKQTFSGWCLFIAGMYILLASGRFSLLSILVPAALLIAAASLTACDKKTRLSHGMKKG